MNSKLMRNTAKQHVAKLSSQTGRLTRACALTQRHAKRSREYQLARISSLVTSEQVMY